MLKQLKNAMLVGVCLLLVTGCTTISAPTAAPALPTATAVAETATPEIVYVVVTATPAPVTATPEMTATATMAPATLVPPTNTPAPTIVYPTATPGGYNDAGTPVKGSSSITITSIQDGGTGKARITWTANGTFSHGFLILYSQSIPNPYYNGFPYYGVGSADRSAYVDVTAGITYYYRVCSFNGSGCDFYSNSFQYVAPGATSTPK